jgi:hypothetical protein
MTVAVGMSLGALMSDGVKADDWQFSGTEIARFALAYEQGLAAGGVPNPVYPNVTYFQGFVNGVLYADLNRRIFCLPANATMGQAWAVVAKFLRENPAQWSRDPSILVEMALSRAFPCDK